MEDLGLFEAPEGTCPECGTQHPPEKPHNQRSLPYKARFYEKNGRLPDWSDAMAHCSPLVQAAWRKALFSRGLDKQAVSI
jgi:hypothetical protein